MSRTNVDRRSVLRSLVGLEQPLDRVLKDLAAAGWDSDEELVTLLPQHVLEVLRRFKAGTMTAQDVERWANAVEGREDIGFEPASRQLVMEAIFDLANPDMQGALTMDLASRWMERLTHVH